MTENERENAMLDDLFGAAQQDPRQEVPSDLIARVLADAEANQPTVDEPVRRAHKFGHRWKQFVAVIGGWPSVTGLAAATVAGVWIGFNASETMLPYGLSGLMTENVEGYLIDLAADDYFDFEDL
ncbi:hypothetical protein [uncultured Shimia sp.]|uniref:hypothetical protein n=1 Tax=uncultured Shimia sp. TaxID=573152 RepID=UPI00261B8AB2|nr:hypothetical protein [uncultured Shimia sp.]